jgi:hypothetical protein
MTWHTSHSDFGRYCKESIRILDYKTLTPLVTGMTKDLTWTLWLYSSKGRVFLWNGRTVNGQELRLRMVVILDMPRLVSADSLPHPACLITHQALLRMRWCVDMS